MEIIMQIISIIKFILEILRKYLGLILTLIIFYLIYKSYYAIDEVSVRGGYYTLYNTLGKSINFLFDNLPKLFIQLPQFKIPSFGFLIRKVPTIPKIPTNINFNINQPGNCGFDFLNPELALCGLEYVFEGGKFVARKIGNVFGSIGGFFCISEESLILMCDNSVKKIKDIKIGDKIKNISGNINEVFFINKEKINSDTVIYGINDIEPFFSESHPIVSGIDKNIVLSINPEITLSENPERKNNIKKLEIGDIILINNKKTKVEKITTKILKKDCYVYDLTFSEMDDISYIANNITIESQEPNYCNTTPIIGNIISELSIIYYEKRKDKDYIKNKIIDFINTNKKYISSSSNIERKGEEKLKLKLINEEKLKICNNMIKESHEDLGDFMNELWVNYYNNLLIFKNISLNDLNKLVYDRI